MSIEETTERIQQLSTVIPRDHSIEFSWFWAYPSSNRYAVDTFCRFLTETGKEYGACDSSTSQPLMLYTRPAVDDIGRIYNADGEVWDEQNGLDGTWGDITDPDGDSITEQPDIVSALVDDLFDMAKGDLSTLPAKLDACDWCIRHIEYLTDFDGTLESLWATETWASFSAWCEEKGIPNPYTTGE